MENSTNMCVLLLIRELLVMSVFPIYHNDIHFFDIAPHWERKGEPA